MMRTDQSTDFEVHRNWKAITNSLPIENWYRDETSEWTLDYPPIFAYMEFILGFISKYFDPQITDLFNLNYNNISCIIYQRITVLISDILLFLSVKKLSTTLQLCNLNRNFLILLVQGYAGLVLVDNMHFQYNTLLFSLFFFSLASVFSGNFLIGAIIYTILLNMKHIFLYMAPAYFVFYLKYYVFKEHKFRFFNLIKLGTCIIFIFIISFSPFIYICVVKEKNPDLLIQILKRLFPFKRGLLHAYWAPNFWALYSFADKILFLLFSRVNLINKVNLSASGLNHDIHFDILPNITTKFANLLIISLSLAFIVKSLLEKYEIRLKKQRLTFIKWLIVSCFIFFNFGFQVHEKAFIKISLLAIVYYIYSVDEHDAGSENIDLKCQRLWQEQISHIMFNLCVMVGIFSQMPLIHTLKDYMVKLFYVLTYLTTVKIFSNLKFKSTHSGIFSFISLLINLQVVVCLILDFIIVIYPLIDLRELFSCSNGDNTLLKMSILKDKFQFLPLMIFSVINSVYLQISFLVTLNIFPLINLKDKFELIK